MKCFCLKGRLAFTLSRLPPPRPFLLSRWKAIWSHCDSWPLRPRPRVAFDQGRRRRGPSDSPEAPQAVLRQRH